MGYQSDYKEFKLQIYNNNKKEISKGKFIDVNSINRTTCTISQIKNTAYHINKFKKRQNKQHTITSPAFFVKTNKI